MAEQVCRIVLVLQTHEPLVIHPEDGLDAFRPFVGLEAVLIDAVSAGGEGTHHL